MQQKAFAGFHSLVIAIKVLLMALGIDLAMLNGKVLALISHWRCSISLIIFSLALAKSLQIQLAALAVSIPDKSARSSDGKIQPYCLAHIHSAQQVVLVPLIRLSSVRIELYNNIVLREHVDECLRMLTNPGGPQQLVAQLGAELERCGGNVALLPPASQRKKLFGSSGIPTEVMQLIETPATALDEGLAFRVLTNALSKRRTEFMSDFDKLFQGQLHEQEAYRITREMLAIASGAAVPAHAPLPPASRPASDVLSPLSSHGGRREQQQQQTIRNNRNTPHSQSEPLGK